MCPDLILVIPAALPEKASSRELELPPATGPFDPLYGSIQAAGRVSHLRVIRQLLAMIPDHIFVIYFLANRKK